MADIVTLVMADHARIRRLFAELETARDSPSRLPIVWTELAGCLEAHLDASEEITYLPLFADSTTGDEDRRQLADQDADIREAVAEARLQPAGSRLWWLVVSAAQTAVDRRIDAIESVPLRRFRQQAPEHAREALGRQWIRFMAALDGDHRTRPDPNGSRELGLLRHRWRHRRRWIGKSPTQRDEWRHRHAESGVIRRRAEGRISL
ncbi:MAG: hemerythrin domain-containing protein [Streptosporangiaceae bacterium]|nr:hemerythrin domain-containing protein [Streptosporangiaceae bacterium]